MTMATNPIDWDEYASCFGGAPAPFAAVREMGAHRRARPLGVLPGDRVVDVFVLAVDAAQIAPVRSVEGFRVEARARDDVHAQGFEQAGEVLVLRRTGDLGVE